MDYELIEDSDGRWYLNHQQVASHKAGLEKAKKDAKDEIWTIDNLWKEYRKQNPHLKGWRTYESQYKLHIEPTLKDKEPGEILPLDVDRLRLQLLKKKSPQTASHVLKLLKRIVKFGSERKLCSNFSFFIKMPSVNNQKTEDLTKEQLAKLLEAIENNNHAQAGPMMLMALYTGMRRGEMLKLKWKDVDFERKFIYIRNPKGGPDQKIPMNGPARSLLKSHPRKAKYVFPGRKGRQRTNIDKPAREIRKAAGLPRTFRPLHGLRHVYASSMASSGKVDMYTLQKLLTHKDPKMTQRYAHLREETLKRAADVAGDIFAEAAKEKDEEKVANLEKHK